MKYKFIIPCEIYNVVCFAVGDVVSVAYVNVSATSIPVVWIDFKGKEYAIPIEVFTFCTERIKEDK